MTDNSAADNGDKLTEDDLAGFGDPTNHYGPAAGAAPVPTTVDEEPRPEFDGTLPIPFPTFGIRKGGIQHAPTLPAPAPLIYRKMIEVARAVGAVGKESVNQQQGYNFRGIDAVVNALHPAMAAAGVFAMPEVLTELYRDTMTTGRDPRPTREVTVKVRYRFFAEDGSSVDAVVPGESLDQSDKGSAKAMSVAFRIALLQAFSLPTSEPDPDASYHTRDGGSAMTPTVAKLLVTRVVTSEPEELAELWPVVIEHAAAERPVPGHGEVTWAAFFKQRFVELIEAVERWEEGRALAQAVRACGMDEALIPLLDARAKELRARGERWFDTLMKQITDARSKQELAVIAAASAELVEKGVLSEVQFKQLNDVMGDRGPKLPATVDQEDAENAQQAAAQ